MSEIPHMPGPWFILLDSETDEPDTSYGFAIQHDGDIVADSIENIETARLIAAAPNLVAALERAKSLLANIGQCNTTTWPDFQIICAALTKAHGG